MQGLTGTEGLVKDPVPVGRLQKVFFLADSVERVARERSRWPPQGVLDPADTAAWQELATHQGHDLERIRSELASAKKERDQMNADLVKARARIRTLSKDNADLRQAVGSLGRMAERHAHNAVNEDGGM